jgi:hypothetical protein
MLSTLQWGNSDGGAGKGSGRGGRFSGDTAHLSIVGDIPELSWGRGAFMERDRTVPCW